LLQETNPEWERAIRAELGERYPHMAFEAPGEYPASGSAILSRVPIEETERLESAVGWFHAQRAIVTVRGERLQLLNVHLKPPVDGGSPILGVTSTGAQREREMRAHLTRLQPGVPTLIAGDFNEGEADVIAMLARERAMHDAFDGAVCGTWHWRYASVELHQSLDHIVLDPGVHAVASWVERVGRSDHFPVVARLSVGPT
jgi:endonuclease/exonuclease/phosphatase family metal-dependent hydrolase